MDKVYILATTHIYESGGNTTLIDVYSNFNDAKNAAIANSNAQKKLEGKNGVTEWVHDEKSCEVGRYIVPNFEFYSPMFMIETRTNFMKKAVTTYRSVIEYKLK